MAGIGSGENGELKFLDILSIVSFLIAIQNLDLNITEQDITNQTRQLDAELKQVVDDIHGHLSVQDAKLNLILNKLEVMSSDEN